MPQAIGVDLGTTFSCVGVLLNSNVDIIPNEMSKRTTPSVVAFNEHNQDPDVGEGAYEQTDPAAIVFEAKRLIGRKFSDLEVQQDVATWPFKVEANEKDDPIVCVNAGGKPKNFKPEEISAMVLAKLKTSADAFVGEEVKKAVITVPAYFNDGQRQATRRAAEIAGLEVLRIINEPTAAAIGYWFQRQGGNRNLLVYDLGGGTFDVSVLQVQDSDITVKATSGNSHLGGSDFDNHILNFCVEEFAKAHNVNITTDKRAMSRLRQRCETAKRTLSGKVEAMIVIDSLINGIDMKQRLSRAKFEDMCRPQLDNTIHLVRAALGDAGLRPTDIDEVILVGGCSKIPKVNLMLSQIFGSDKIRKNINCDEAVAFGAAVLAAKLAENPSVQIGEKSVKAPIPAPRLPKIGTLNEKDTALLRNLQLNDITPLSLGIEIAGGAMVTIIPKNTRIPVTKEKVFRAASDTTTSIRLSLYQGENDVAKLNTHLGNLFMQLKPGQGNSRVVVVIDVDVNGIIKIRAQSEATGAEVSLVVNDRRGH